MASWLEYLQIRKLGRNPSDRLFEIKCDGVSVQCKAHDGVMQETLARRHPCWLSAERVAIVMLLGQIANLQFCTILLTRVLKFPTLHLPRQEERKREGKSKGWIRVDNVALS